MEAGETSTLSAVIKPERKRPLYDENIRWYTSTPGLISVGVRTGEVRALKDGVARLWAKAHNGRNSKTVFIYIDSDD